MKNIAILAALVAASSSANAQLKITEVMYKGMFGEFVEVTNTGSLISNISTYSYDDSGAVPGKVPFPAVSLANNQCVIITEVSEDIFNLAWYTEPTGDNGYSFTAPVIVDYCTDNLGRADTINIFSGSFVQDSLSYNDERVISTVLVPNGPRTEDVSAVPVSNWAFAESDMYPYTGGATNNPANYRKDWVLSNDARVASKWQSGNPAQSSGSAPIGSPGLFSTATPLP